MENRSKARTIAEYAIFVAIIFVMRVTGLSSIPVGPLVMTLTMIPLPIGSMLLGPLGGTVLGTVFGLTSLYDAMIGKAAMTVFFF